MSGTCWRRSQRVSCGDGRIQRETLKRFRPWTSLEQVAEIDGL